MKLLVTATVMPCLMAGAIAPAQSPTAPTSDPISLEQINLKEYEPVVGEQIRAAYEEARQNPLDAEAMGKLGMIFQCYGEYGLAETCYRQALALAPRSFRWEYYLGNVEAWQGKYQDAVHHIREALEIEGSHASARVRLGQLLAHLGFLGEAHLDRGLGYIEDDELVEVTPKGIRLRKALLKEADRRRYARQA